jgi:hypothetical protein
MQRLGSFSDEFQPVLEDLHGAAPAVNRLFRAQGPFAQASIPAIRSLGETADVGRPALLRSKPIIDDIRRLTDEAAPLAKDLAELLVSLRDTSGVERLMDYIFYQAGAINGYDQFGHYLRAGLIVNTCSEYAVDPVGGCSAKFQQPASASARAATMDRGNILQTFGAGGANADAFVGEDRSAQRRQGAAATQSGSGADRRPSRSSCPRCCSPARTTRRCLTRPTRAPRRPPAARPLLRPTASSTTSWGMGHEAARRSLHRGEPRAHRRGDDPRRHRRGVPRLQREQRPAVRPDLRAQDPGPERGEPRARQRGADRRHAHRRHRRDQADQPARRPVDRRAEPQARDRRRPAPGRLGASSCVRARRSA